MTKTKKWFETAVFYHLYPLGACGAEAVNTENTPQTNRLEQLRQWIPYLTDLGITALYLGPVWESESHGYDTIDYFRTDKRLGDNDVLKKVIRKFQDNGIAVILDGVFNHTGRTFFAFEDLRQNKQDSPYKYWYDQVDFSTDTDYEDGFGYGCWNGCHNLPKLNLANTRVTEYLLEAVKFWIDEFNIDGLRLDAADVLDFNFMRTLSSTVKSIRPDFYLLGETIHGDYSRWANREMLDSVTNYECYKGLYSSHNDRNYFEIAWSLDRQFDTDNGLYKELPLYNFCDNHDVHRIASILKNRAHIYPLNLLLFTMPGTPSLYYGSEWAIEGEKGSHSDRQLRPEIRPEFLEMPSDPDFHSAIKRFIRLRKNHPALISGTYKTIAVQSLQLAFLRETDEERLLIILNGEDHPVDIMFPTQRDWTWGKDVLNPGEEFPLAGSEVTIPLYSQWGRILRIT